jgi:hypothetical protein
MPTKSAFSALGAPRSLAWVHESPVSRVWHCQNPSKVAISASTRPASGGCRLLSVRRSDIIATILPLSSECVGSGWRLAHFTSAWYNRWIDAPGRTPGAHKPCTGARINGKLDAMRLAARQTYLDRFTQEKFLEYIGALFRETDQHSP